ncbi:hypothetical protein HDU97_002435 [Phlyctochytrium planicorne]|nr:hypothetical protein HDU97_002435 [Phlyctochytrium planicorne]
MKEDFKTKLENENGADQKRVAIYVKSLEHSEVYRMTWRGTCMAAKLRGVNFSIQTKLGSYFPYIDTSKCFFGIPLVSMAVDYKSAMEKFLQDFIIVNRCLKHYDLPDVITNLKTVGLIISDVWLQAMNADLEGRENDPTEEDEFVLRQARATSAMNDAISTLNEAFDKPKEAVVALDEWNTAKPMSPTAKMFAYRAAENESMLIDITDFSGLPERSPSTAALSPVTPLDSMPRSRSAMNLSTSSAKSDLMGSLSMGSALHLAADSNGNLRQNLKSAPSDSIRQIERDAITGVQQEEEGSRTHLPSQLEISKKPATPIGGSILSLTQTITADKINVLDPKTMKLLQNKDEDHEVTDGYGVGAQESEPIRASLIEDVYARKMLLYQRSFRHSLTMSEERTLFAENLEDIEEYLSNYIFIRNVSKPPTPISVMLRQIDDLEGERLRREAEEKKAKVSHITIALLSEGVPSSEAEKEDPTFKTPYICEPYKGSERAKRAGMLRPEDLPRAIQVLERIEAEVTGRRKSVKSVKSSRLNTPSSTLRPPNLGLDIAGENSLGSDSQITNEMIQATIAPLVVPSLTRSTPPGNSNGNGNGFLDQNFRSREPSNVEAVLAKMAKLSERADAVSNNFAKHLEENQKKMDRVKEEKAKARRVSQLTAGSAGSSQSLGSLSQFQENFLTESTFMLESVDEKKEDTEVKAKTIITDLLASISDQQEETTVAPKKASRGRLGVGNKKH